MELFDDLVAARHEGPWLAVASFLNPHDISGYGLAYDQLWGFSQPTDDIPMIPEAPSQADGFADRPHCHPAYLRAWSEAIYEQPPDVGYRRLYYHLHQVVDRAIAKVLDALERSGMADDTIVVFTSDHGDLLGAHGGLHQKWHNAFDETVRVPLLVKGPGVVARPGGITTPTSHIDLVPTLLGLAGIDLEQATAGVMAHHVQTQPLPGRDLSAVISGSSSSDSIDQPIYFMTEDEFSRGSSQVNLITGQPYEAVPTPCRVESVITSLPTGPAGGEELWKLNHYYERLDDWMADQGVAVAAGTPPAAESFFELHNLTRDPEERHNVTSEASALSALQSVLEQQRDVKRLLPALRNDPT